MKKSSSMISKFEKQLKQNQKLSSDSKTNIKGGIIPVTFLASVALELHDFGMDIYNWLND